MTRQFGLPASTVRAIDLRCLARRGGSRRCVRSWMRSIWGKRREEFFRKGGSMRGVVKGERWLLLSRWGNLDTGKKRQLNTMSALNRRVMKAYLLKESLDRLWTYHYEGAMIRYVRTGSIS